MPTIVKLQLPLFPKQGAVLVYDRKREHIETYPMNRLSRLTHDALGGDFIAYFEAEPSGDPYGLYWTIGARVANQEW